MRKWFPILLLGLCLAAPVFADEDADLFAIPDELLDAPPPVVETTPPWPKPKWETAGSVEVEGQRGWERGNLATPLPPGNGPFVNHQLRASLSLRLRGKISQNTTLHLQDRLTWRAMEDDGPTAASLQNDLKELYLSHELGGGHFLDLGRINIKEGVGTGFNPTDWFKAGALATRTSEDPGDARDDRLGTVMARWQWLHERASFSLAYAPEVDDQPGRWWNDDGDGGLNLHRTNARPRLFLKLTPFLSKDNPELSYYREGGRSHFGINLTKGVGQRWVVYGEWRLHRSGGTTETLGAAAPGALVLDDRLRQQASLGFSYTDDDKRSYWLEYQINQGGLSPAGWDSWFALGAQARALMQNAGTAAQGAALLGRAWAVRQTNQALQEPLNRQAVFFRFSWPEAWHPELEFSGIAILNPDDGSLFLQPQLTYTPTTNRSVTLTLGHFLGGPRTEFGSLPGRHTARLGYTWFF